jgi:hypothetical protein
MMGATPQGGAAMKQQDNSKVGRRAFLRTVGLGAGLAATAAVPLTVPAAAAESDSEKKKARYNPNSEDVKNFYRVNRN